MHSYYYTIKQPRSACLLQVHCRTSFFLSTGTPPPPITGCQVNSGLPLKQGWGGGGRTSLQTTSPPWDSLQYPNVCICSPCSWCLLGWYPRDAPAKMLWSFFLRVRACVCLSACVWLSLIHTLPPPPTQLTGIYSILLDSKDAGTLSGSCRQPMGENRGFCCICKLH